MRNGGGVSHREGIFQPLRSPGIDSKESIPPICVARWSGTITLYSYSVTNSQRLFKNSSTEPELLNFEGAQESIPRNQFRQAV
jgi:hypothetical protein